MATAIHKIDPQADTVLVLKNPNASFASWGSNNLEENATMSIEHPVGGDADAQARDQTASITTSLCEASLADGCVPGEEVHYHVSSRHLTLASPTFAGMLSGENWKEGIRDEVDDRYYLTASDWDAEALLVIFSVLHHRNRLVPRTVSLELLAKLAVLIDYYGCAEALESFTERWVEQLRRASPVPALVCRDLMLWMCVAWVLRLPGEFAQTTTVAIRRDGEELPTLGLPIASCVGKSANWDEVTCD